MEGRAEPDLADFVRVDLQRSRPSAMGVLTRLKVLGLMEWCGMKSAYTAEGGFSGEVGFFPALRLLGLGTCPRIAN